MIKIIKNPIETFIMKCPICGCEFSYEVSDVDTLALTPTVRCPGCGDNLSHTIEDYSPCAIVYGVDDV